MEMITNMRRKLLISGLVLLTGALLLACEGAPGEVTGRVRYSSGKAAAVMITIKNQKGKVIWQGASDLDGTWYTRPVIPPGTYTIHYFDRNDKEFEGTQQEITVSPGGIVSIEQTL